MAGYFPLGMGLVDIESILNTLEEAGDNPDVMHELDRGNAPMTARKPPPSARPISSSPDAPFAADFFRGAHALQTFRTIHGAAAFVAQDG
jgi:hypothetical protein